MGIKEFVKIGVNEIKIIFYSPVNYVSEKYSKCKTPINSNGQNGIVHIRKPQYHFGWDWAPVLPCSGLGECIRLEFVNKARIEYLGATQDISGGKAKISVDVNVVSYGKYSCKTALEMPDGSVITADGVKACFDIEKPELWQTYELSHKKRQPLYKITASLYDGGTLLDRSSKKIGLRTIELKHRRIELHTP